MAYSKLVYTFLFFLFLITIFPAPKTVSGTYRAFTNICWTNEETPCLVSTFPRPTEQNDRQVGGIQYVFTVLKEQLKNMKEVKKYQQVNFTATILERKVVFPRWYLHGYYSYFQMFSFPCIPSDCPQLVLYVHLLTSWTNSLTELTGYIYLYLV